MASRRGEQRVALLDGLVALKAAPRAHGSEVVGAGLGLAGDAAQCLGARLGHERGEQVSGDADGLEQVVDHEGELVGLLGILGQCPGLGVLDVVVGGVDELHGLVLGAGVVEHLHARGVASQMPSAMSASGFANAWASAGRAGSRRRSTSLMFSEREMRLPQLLARSAL